MVLLQVSFKKPAKPSQISTLSKHNNIYFLNCATLLKLNLLTLVCVVENREKKLCDWLFKVYVTPCDIRCC